MSVSSTRTGASVFPQWYRDIRAYQRSSKGRAVWQLVNTLVPYLMLWASMIVMLSRGMPYWSILPVAVAAAFFLVRTFIIFHDCCHGSFLPSAVGNRIVGYLTGVLTFTSFQSWRVDHLRHHATSGQLDHRGFGDVWTMTCEEYQSASWFTRLKYRVYRTPFFMFFFGPLFVFVIGNRFTPKGSTARERRSVVATNLGIALLATALSLGFGWRAYVGIQLPVILLSGTIGIWLFYVQHQFDPGYWERDGRWDQYRAAMAGASYYRLPGILRWLTGNIGIHHIHHLRPRIPNYHLWEALRSAPEASNVDSLSFLQSLRALRFNLWHEGEKRFLSFRQARRIPAAS